MHEKGGTRRAPPRDLSFSCLQDQPDWRLCEDLCSLADEVEWFFLGTKSSRKSKGASALKFLLSVAPLGPANTLRGLPRKHQVTFGRRGTYNSCNGKYTESMG